MNSQRAVDNVQASFWGLGKHPATAHGATSLLKTNWTYGPALHARAVFAGQQGSLDALSLHRANRRGILLIPTPVLGMFRFSAGEQRIERRDRKQGEKRTDHHAAH